MKYIIGALAAFTILAAIGRKQQEINALRDENECLHDELDDSQTVREAMVTELRSYQQSPQPQAAPPLAATGFARWRTNH